MKAKKKKKHALQYEYAKGLRSSKQFWLRAAVKTAFHALAKASRCNQQELMEALILRAVAASPEDKAELFRAAHEAERTSALARIERKYPSEVAA